MRTLGSQLEHREARSTATARRRETHDATANVAPYGIPSARRPNKSTISPSLPFDLNPARRVRQATKDTTVTATDLARTCLGASLSEGFTSLRHASTLPT